MKNVNRPTQAEEWLIAAVNRYHPVPSHEKPQRVWLSLTLLWVSRLCWVATILCVVMGVLYSAGVLHG